MTTVNSENNILENIKIEISRSLHVVFKSLLESINIYKERLRKKKQKTKITNDRTNKGITDVKMMIRLKPK